MLKLFLFILVLHHNAEFRKEYFTWIMSFSFDNDAELDVHAVAFGLLSDTRWLVPLLETEQVWYQGFLITFDLCYTMF